MNCTALSFSAKDIGKKYKKYIKLYMILKCLLIFYFSLGVKRDLFGDFLSALKTIENKNTRL